MEQLVEWELARETLEHLAPMPLCSPQIPHDLAHHCGKLVTIHLSYGTADKNIKCHAE
jgi:hypothetical protein